MAQYKGFSYDEYIKPLEQMQKVHNDTLADMNNMSATSDILDFYIDPNDPDSQESYALYNNFKTEFNKQAEDFAKNGLTRSNGMNLLRLHRNYNNNVANVLDALKNKKTEEAEQQKLQETSKGQEVFSRNSFDTGTDFYLHGNKGYYHQNLDEIRKYAKNLAAAASARYVYDGNSNAQSLDEQKMFNNEFWRRWKSVGYDDKQAWNIISELMTAYSSPENLGTVEHPGFIRNMMNAMQERDFDKFKSPEQARMITAYIDGIEEGLTYKEEEQLHQTEESKARVAAKGKSVININKGDVQYDSLPVNEFEVPIESTFEDDQPNWFTDFFRTSRTNALENINKNPYIFADTEFINVGDDGFEHRGRRLLSENEYYNKVKELNDRQGILYTEQSIRDAYKEQLSDLKRLYRLDNNMLNALTKPKNYSQTFDEFLKNREKQIEGYSNGQKVPVYQLPIKDDDKLKLLFESGNIGGEFVDLKMNPETGMYSKGKDKSEKIIDEYESLDTDIRKSTKVFIKYAPIPGQRDMFWIGYMNKKVNGGNPIYVPVSAYASNRAGDIANEAQNSILSINQLQDELKRLQLGNEKDQRIAKAISDNEVLRSNLIKQILRQVAGHANPNIKQAITDLSENNELYINSQTREVSKPKKK